MKTVFHVGPHKTGTTSLQYFLSDNAQALAKRRVHVPGIQSLDGSPNHWYLIYIAASSYARAATYHNSVRGKHTERQCKGFRQQYEKQLRQFLERARDQEKSTGEPSIFAISTEEIAFLNREENNSLYKLFLEYCDEVSVLYYYRSPIDRLRSDLQQGSKGGHVYHPNVLKGLPCQDSARMIKLIPEPALDGKVRIQVRPYMRDLSGHKDWDIRFDFCEAVGITHDDLRIPAKDPGANASISLQMFTILQSVNRMMPTLGPKGRFNDLKRYFHDAVEAYRWTPEDTPFRFSQRDIEELLKGEAQMRAFLEMGNSTECITMHPDCQTVFDSMATTHAEPNVEGSIFEHVPAMSHTYYTNTLCHFWSYLQRVKK